MSDIKRLTSAVFLVGTFAWHGGAIAELSAAPRADWCYNLCDAEQDCATECENDGGGTITCGDYHDGPEGDWCDGDTCDNVCGPYAAPGTECYFEDDYVDCYTYGDYVTCGDDYCANISGTETCETCVADCDTCPPIVCGDATCDSGETYRNCDLDCGEPSGGYCGDANCKEGEGVECPECRTPEEFCGWDYGCPGGFQCVGNQCVHEEFIGFLSTCPTGQCFESSDVCRQAMNVMTGTPVPVCVPWYWD